MKHEITESGGNLIVAFDGDVDLDHSPEARKILLECVSRKMPIYVDLSKVNYIDSSGVASLVESLQHARKAGLEYALVSVSESALRVLQLARLDQVFTIHDSLPGDVA